MREHTRVIHDARTVPGLTSRMLSKSFVLAHADQPLSRILELISIRKAEYLVLTRTSGRRRYRYVIPVRTLLREVDSLKLDKSGTAAGLFDLAEDASNPAVTARARPRKRLSELVGGTFRPATLSSSPTGRVVGIFDPFAHDPSLSFDLRSLRYERTRAKAPRLVPLPIPDLGIEDGGQSFEDVAANGSNAGEFVRAFGEGLDVKQPSAVDASAAPPSVERQLPKEFERFPRAIFSEKVMLGRPAPLTVVIDAERTSSSDTSMLLKAAREESDVTVLVVVQAEGFEIQGENAKEIQVPVTPRTAPPAVFELVPRRLGEQIILVRFYPRGGPGPELKVRTKVVPTLEDVGGVGNLASLANVSLKGVLPNPDLTLVITGGLVDGRLEYEVGLWSQILRMPWASLGKISFPADAEGQFRAFYSSIERIQFDSTSAKEQMASAGRDLYSNVLPPKLQERYWDLRDKISSIQVISSEPWVPWEILKPWDRATGKDDEFLCQKHSFARWLNGWPTQAKPVVSSVKVVAPLGANLSGTREESAWIQNYGAAHGFKVSAVSDFDGVISSLRTGGFDILHISSHGRFEPTLPTGSAILLDAGVELHPQNISGPSTAFGTSNPIVILNACQTAAQGRAFTRLGGWATSFIEAGASAFIGTQWSVRDSAALTFTKAFYAALSAGRPLGLAARDARTACQTNGDPSWLAYQLYAHPLAAPRLGTI